MDYILRIQQKKKIIYSYMGVILIVISSIMGFSAFSTFLFNESYIFWSFAKPSLISLLVGLVLRYYNKTENNFSIKSSEGGIIVILSWILAILISTWPFIDLKILNFTQALFETTSGWTTTGLSVVDVTSVPKSILLFRSTMQYFGGSGLAVATMALLLGPAASTLYGAEGRTDRLLPNIKKSVKLIMSLYTGFTVLGILLYLIAGMNLFDSVNHSIAAISTGGFSTRVGSIGEFESALIEFITIFLMLIGTINFAAHYVLLKGNYKKFIKIDEIQFLFKLLIVIIPVAFFSLYNLYDSFSKTLRVSIFDFISALSTTGFSSVSYSDWSELTIFLMIILMIIGGGSGSTAGGLKLHRGNLIIKSIWFNIRSKIMPKNNIKVDSLMRPEGEVFLDDRYIQDTLSFGYLYIFFLILGSVILMLNGFGALESIFEYASCLSTVGLSLGITSPNLPPSILLVMSFGMFLGRLEFLVIIVTILKILDGWIKDFTYKKN